MKTGLYILAIMIGVLGISQAQEIHEESFTIPLSKPGSSGKLDIDLHNGGVTVEGYGGSEVMIIMKTYVEKENNQESDREGLKRIANSGMDVEISEEDNVVEIDGGHSGRADFIVKVPAKFDLDIGTHHNGEVNISNISGEVEVDCHHGAISMKKISGSIIADTHHGGITATFVSVTPDKPMAFSTYHGDVDITFPAGTNFDAKVKSVKGDIYTDFDVEMKLQQAQDKTSDSGRREIKIGGWMFGEVGTGGQEYMFNTYHGDVIMRKS